MTLTYVFSYNCRTDHSQWDCLPLIRAMWPLLQCLVNIADLWGRGCIETSFSGTCI